MAFRDEFPEAVKLADEVRAIFGDGVKLIHAVEGDRVMTTQKQVEIDGMQVMDSEQYLDISRLSAFNADQVSKKRK